jgi:hypothetical protein
MVDREVANLFFSLKFSAIGSAGKNPPDRSCRALNLEFGTDVHPARKSMGASACQF